MTEELGDPTTDSCMQETEAYQSFPLTFQPLTVNPLYLTPSANVPYHNRYYHRPLLSPAECAASHFLGHAGVSCWGTPDVTSLEGAHPGSGELLRCQSLVSGSIKQEIHPAGATWDTSEGQMYPMPPSPTSTQIMETDDSGVDPQANVQRPSAPEQNRVTPLQCLLCPKEPKFSDVSHLLTHISSKSHLACRFRLELQKKSDVVAKSKIIAFDEWYQRNRVEALLDNRMAAKKDKTTALRSKASTGGTKRRRSATTTTTTTTTVDSPATRNKPHQPHLHHWNTSSGRASLHLHESRDDVKSEDAYYTPSEDRTEPEISLTMSSQTSRVTRSRAKQISATSKQEQTDHTDTTIPSESTAASADAGEVDATKLKGIVWPGMGIFDAATSEQKRMRNQKKDSSVLQNMITTSKSVHHDKFVWDDDFAGVPRIRDIYASPSTDGSPDADEDEDKQAKKKRGRRPAMVEDGDSIRQTRSTTKAATQGRRGPKPKMPLKKVKDESDSDAEEMNDGLSDDVFHDNRTRRSGAVNGRSRPSLNQNQDNFELPGRPALQNLNSNAPLGSPTPVFKQRNHSYPAFGAKEHELHAYPAQSSVTPPVHFGQRLFPNPAGPNPLFHPQSQNGPPMPYSAPTYGQQARPANSFLSVNQPQQYVPGSWPSLEEYMSGRDAGNTAQYDF